MSIETALARKDIAFDLLCLGIREGGTYELLEAMRGALTGSHPSDHAQRHGGSRFDPARKGVRRAD